jgi:hypothetical protein
VVTTTPWTLPSPSVGGTSNPPIDDSSTRVPSVSFGSPQVSVPNTPAPTPQSDSSIVPTPQSDSSIVPANPSTSDIQPAPAPSTSDQGGASTSMLAGSIAEIVTKSWPYLLSGVAVSAICLLAYRLGTKED